MPTFREYVPSFRRDLVPGVFHDAAAARAMGLSLPRWRAAQAARIDLLPHLGLLENGLVLDLGANVGDWTSALLTAVPSARVIAVEPGAEPRATLESRFGTDSRVTIDPRAVAGSAGTAELHVTEHSHNSSLHAPLEMDGEYGRGWQVSKVVSVETTTIDALADGREIALIKIDVQGAEREVLGGAAATLPHTAAVLLEVTFVSHYEGDATFPTLHDQMTESGFVMSGLSRPFMSVHGTVLWCDACYVRA